MSRHVIVSFGPSDEFEFSLAGSDHGSTAEAARQWFDREFVALECDVPSPIGKILNADRVLSVAKYAGVDRFRGHTAWAEQFARNAAALLDRDLIRVDVPNYTVGY